jgi:hypothetical protein
MVQLALIGLPYGECDKNGVVDSHGVSSTSFCGWVGLLLGGHINMGKGILLTTGG